MNKASALAYSTLLAIVPILAIVFIVAREFGFDDLMGSQIVKGFGGPSETTEVIFQFVNSYLSRTKSGVFIGVGLIILSRTVLNLIDNTEIIFSRIWQVKKVRSIYRKITNYFSMLLLIPLLLMVSDDLSIFMSTILENIADLTLPAPTGKLPIRFIPFVLTWFMFTGLYVFIPNTKVKLKRALISGVLAGTTHQAFQFLYISSQLWVSRYNAIYSSFATPPIFLLWLQISWTTCPFRAELIYAGQNIRNFSFDKDAHNISRRYRDFIPALIMSLMAKRFEKNKPPYTAEDISEECQIPIRPANQTLYELQEINLSHEAMTDAKSQDIAYQPSMDINKFSIALLLDKLDTRGSEDFETDKGKGFHRQWETLMKAREECFRNANRVSLKGL